jgi:membrane fusion protein (multidrug efflux system)
MITSERLTIQHNRRSSEQAEEGADVALAPAAHADADASEGGISFLRRHPLSVMLAVVVLLTLLAAGYFYWRSEIHPFESTDDAFVDARQFVVAPKVSGYVVDVAVIDNQHVDAGDLLARIDPRDYQIALRQAQASEQAAIASVESIEAEIASQQAQVVEAKAELQRAQAGLTFADAQARRYGELASSGFGSRQQSEQATSEQAQQTAAVAQARAAEASASQVIKSLEAKRASASAQLAQVKAQLAGAELNLSYTTLTAAESGQIVRLAAAKGQLAQPGQSLAIFVPDDKWVTANFKETQITDMRPGQPVKIEIDAYPAANIRGRVDSVQPGSGTAFSLLPAENATGNYIKVVQRVPVKIVVDRWPEGIAIGPGMSVVPTVTVRPDE